MRQGIYTQILMFVYVLSENVYSSCFTHTVCTNQCTYVLTKVALPFSQLCHPKKKLYITQFAFRYTNRQKCYRCEINYFHLNFEGFVNNIMKKITLTYRLFCNCWEGRNFKSSSRTLQVFTADTLLYVPTLRQFMYPLQRTDRFRAQSTGCTAFRMSQLSLWESKLLYILDKISTDRTVKHRPSM